MRAASCPLAEADVFTELLSYRGRCRERRFSPPRVRGAGPDEAHLPDELFAASSAWDPRNRARFTNDAIEITVSYSLDPCVSAEDSSPDVCVEFCKSHLAVRIYRL